MENKRVSKDPSQEQNQSSYSPPSDPEFRESEEGNDARNVRRKRAKKNIDSSSNPSQEQNDQAGRSTTKRNQSPIRLVRAKTVQIPTAEDCYSVASPAPSCSRPPKKKARMDSASNPPTGQEDSSQAVSNPSPSPSTAPLLKPLQYPVASYPYMQKPFTAQSNPIPALLAASPSSSTSPSTSLNLDPFIEAVRNAFPVPISKDSTPSAPPALPLASATSSHFSSGLFLKTPTDALPPTLIPRLASLNLNPAPPNSGGYLRYHCGGCHEAFMSRDALWRHIMGVHSNSYECVTCAVRFSSNESFQKHVLDHIRGTI